jgi:chromosome segregation ATPase
MAKKTKSKKPASGALTLSLSLDRMSSAIAEVSKHVESLQADFNRTAIKISDLNRWHEALVNKVQALEGDAEVRSAAITQVSDLFTTLRRVLNNASAELAGAASYTQQEISRISADEYREKVLVPLNMGRRV